MKNLVDITRISPSGDSAFTVLQQYREAATIGIDPIKLASKECNGFWHKIAGLQTQP